jgi:3-hydroxyisobutyrate dehydrogenase-like beta-hydroxyacid dehydrogenase
MNAMKSSWSVLAFSRRNFSTPSLKIGFVGLGHMGSNMVQNLSKDGQSVMVYDTSDKAVSKVVNNQVVYGSLHSISNNCDVVFSMLPNDKIVEQTSHDLINHVASGSSKNKFLHISCSTISPMTSRKLAEAHKAAGHSFVAAPVFARPDGIAKRQATWLIAGAEGDRDIAKKLLTPAGNCVDMGNDVGSSNVVKLCGNFMIAVTQPLCIPKFKISCDVTMFIRSLFHILNRRV